MTWYSENLQSKKGNYSLFPFEKSIIRKNEVKSDFFYSYTQEVHNEELYHYREWSCI